MKKVLFILVCCVVMAGCSFEEAEVFDAEKEIAELKELIEEHDHSFKYGKPFSNSWGYCCFREETGYQEVIDLLLNEMNLKVETIPETSKKAKLAPKPKLLQYKKEVEP